MKRREFNDGRGVLRLWGGWGLAILAWVLHLGVSYGIVGWYCERGQHLAEATIEAMLHGVTLIALLMAAGGTFLAWRNWQQASQSQDVRPRSRFMALAGVLLSLLMLTIILIQGLPIMLLELCQ